jgi:hypothetical protein
VKGVTMFKVARCYFCGKPIFKGPVHFDENGDYHKECAEKYLTDKKENK